mgnify:CR=1 FL=1
MSYSFYKRIGIIILTIIILAATLVVLSSCIQSGDSDDVDKDLKVELYSVDQSTDLAVDNEKKTVDFAVSVTSEKFSLSRISFRNNSEIVFKAYYDKELTKEIENEVTLSVGENIFYIQAWHKDAPSEKVTYTVTVTKPVAHVHAFGQWTIVTEATCTENGLQERVCDCGEKESEVVEAKGHTFGEWTVVIEASCEDNGQEKHICEVCDEEETRTTLPLGHNYDEGKVTTEATCTEDGVKTFTCQRDGCGDTYTEVIPAKGHTFIDGVCEICGTELNYTEGLSYELNEEGTGYTVTGIGTATDTDIVIPSEYKGLPVTSIGDYAFSEGTSLTSIDIPDSVTSIGVQAFSSCTSLTSIDIPDSVTSIGDWAFSSCTSLTSITVDENNTAYASIDGNLYNKDKTTLIQYAIGKTATEFTIPDSVTSIGDNAFSEGTSLTSIDIPDSVTSIGSFAFSYCRSLTNVTIGNGVTSIGVWAFHSCYSLTSITVDENNTAYASIDGNLYNKDKTTLIQYAIGKTATEFTIPDSVTSIGSYAFARCDSLTSIVIPDGVTSIGDNAFFWCDSLTSVTIGNSVTSIGDNAFAWCDSLTDVYYGGTEEQWKSVLIGGGNKYLTSANIHFSAK